MICVQTQLERVGKLRWKSTEALTVAIDGPAGAGKSTVGQEHVAGG